MMTHLARADGGRDGGRDAFAKGVGADAVEEEVEGLPGGEEAVGDVDGLLVVRGVELDDEEDGGGAVEEEEGAHDHAHHHSDLPLVHRRHPSRVRPPENGQCLPTLSATSPGMRALEK